jgi:hypothetical protein
VLDRVDEAGFPITIYGIYQRVDDPGLIANVLAEGTAADRDGGPLPGAETMRTPVSLSNPLWNVRRWGDREFLVPLSAAAPPGVWEVVGTVPARQEQNYIFRAPTVVDSSDTIVYSVYFISAHTTTPSMFFDSPPDSGYSVDNIAPGVPQNMTAAYNTGSGNQLGWDPSPEPDFQYYRIYRDTDPNFMPGPGSLVHSTATPNRTDPDFDGGMVYYKVTALDHAGNESGPASAGAPTGVEDPALPARFALHQNVPNPFNPSTIIAYDVPAGGGEVTLRIFDVNGQLLRTVADGPQTAGKKRVTWDARNDGGNSVASGVYFYRMTAPGFAKTRKMVLMR